MNVCLNMQTMASSSAKRLRRRLSVSVRVICLGLYACIESASFNISVSMLIPDISYENTSISSADTVCMKIQIFQILFHNSRNCSDTVDFTDCLKTRQS